MMNVPAIRRIRTRPFPIHVPALFILALLFLATTSDAQSLPRPGPNSVPLPTSPRSSGEADHPIVTYILRNVLKWDDEKIARVVDKPVRPSHPGVIDIGDANYEELLIGNGDASDGDVWAIAVVGNDEHSKMVEQTFLQTVDILHKRQSQAGDAPLIDPAAFQEGKREQQVMRFGRVDYMTVDVLTTRWWIFKPPILVLSTDNMRSLRFIRIRDVDPVHLSSFLSPEDAHWKTRPEWVGLLAPGGSLSPILPSLGLFFGYLRRGTETIPAPLLMVLTATVGQLLIGWMHSMGKKKGPPAAGSDAARGKVTQKAGAKAPAAEGESDPGGIDRKAKRGKQGAKDK